MVAIKAKVEDETVGEELTRLRGRALGVAGAVWRKRATGHLQIALSAGTRSIPVVDGGLSKPADFQSLNAYAHRPARFQPGGSGPKGNWEELGRFLLRKASSRPLSCPQDAALFCALSPEALAALGVSIPALCAEKPPSVGELQDVLDEEQMATVWRLLHLGHARLKNQRVQAVETALAEVLEREALARHREATRSTRHLVARYIELAKAGKWSEAAQVLVGAPFDEPEIAACRALSVMQDQSLPPEERLERSGRWAGLARGLGASPTTAMLLQAVDKRVKALRKKQG